MMLIALPLAAETGEDAWLRYAPVARHPELPATVTLVGDSPVLMNAREELIRAVRGMLGRTLRIEAELPREDGIVLGRIEALRSQFPALQGDLATDGFAITSQQTRGHRYLVVTAPNDRGVLYGVFALVRQVALNGPLERRESPAGPIRWINHWDNLDGTIERGYGGRSIFWDAGHVRTDLTRVSEYGRLLASLGINACSINNVNANPRVVASDFLPQVARIAAALRPWGVQLVVAVDFASPKTTGGLETFDPLDAKVAAWWQEKVEEIYRAVPDLAGIVIKADSEGRAGPSAYGRTHADAANVVARPLKAHGGLLLYRGFVYDHHMDWRNLKNDRARAAWDNFHDLDGKFEDNVVLQIKHGPIDFQVREPASPLFAALRKTNQAIELQITQEYFGQSRHTVYLAPMWKEALDFDMGVDGRRTPVSELVTGKTFARPAGGFVGVSNVGLNTNWFGNHLSQSNLYAFGRLAWNPALTARQIDEEWIGQTFGTDPKVLRTIGEIQMSSWRTYEKYTGPLGLQTLTDIVGNHYGVSVEASERNGWGQWHRSDEKGAGMDRTLATGTGFAGQYPGAVAKMWESAATCPDELLLFFHHVPYTHRLHSGKTVIQHIYDTHYEGAEAVSGYLRSWGTLRGLIDDDRFQAVRKQLEYQAGQAEVWRDAVVSWYLRASGIADSKGRAGKHPRRYEAEAMELDGYTPVDVTPWEAASGGKAVSCERQSCAATLRWDGAAGWYEVRVRYFDQNNGAARYRVSVGAQAIAEWIADDRVPSRKLDGSTSALRVIQGVALRPADAIRIEGVPDGGESAALDYVEIVRR